MPNALRVAVIGTGHLGKFHTRILAGLPQVELVGVVDTNLDAARQVAAQYNTQAFASHQPLLGQIDAAIIAVPTRFHHQVGMELLEHRVHLMIEKPLALSFVQGWQLVEAAKHRGLALAVGHVERFNPAWNVVETQVEDPKYIEANRLASYTFRSNDIGVVLDLMIHDLDLILALVKQPVERIEAVGISIFGQHEDVANARLTFSGGCVATINASRASYVAERTMQLWSPWCFVAADFAARGAQVVRPNESILSRKFAFDKLTAVEQDAVKKNLFTEHLKLEQVTPDPCDQLTAELEDFLAAIREARAPRVDGAQACTALAVAERILSKIQTHVWDGGSKGVRGPLAVPPAAAGHPIPAPHWGKVGARAMEEAKKSA